MKNLVTPAKTRRVGRNESEQRQISQGANEEFHINTGNWQHDQENGCGQVTIIGFSFASVGSVGGTSF